MLLNFCFTPISLSFIMRAGDRLRQEFRRVEGKLHFLPYRNPLFHYWEFHHSYVQSLY